MPCQKKARMYFLLKKYILSQLKYISKFVKCIYIIIYIYIKADLHKTRLSKRTQCLKKNMGIKK